MIMVALEASNNQQALGERNKAEVFRLTGLPVYVGISKTLTKMANKTAKHIKELAGRASGIVPRNNPPRIC